MFNHLQNENNQTPKSLFTLTQEDVFTSSPIVTQSPIIQNNTLNNLINIKNIKDYETNNKELSLISTISSQDHENQLDQSYSNPQDILGFSQDQENQSCLNPQNTLEFSQDYENQLCSNQENILEHSQNQENPFHSNPQNTSSLLEINQTINTTPIVDIQTINEINYLSDTLISYPPIFFNIELSGIPPAVTNLDI